jgi:hypothetical protein
MVQVDHPLDWWATGGYPLVMRELRCSKAMARRRVHAALARGFRQTGDPRWKPYGHRGYAQLRRWIREGTETDELV